MSLYSALSRAINRCPISLAGIRADGKLGLSGSEIGPCRVGIGIMSEIHKVVRI